MAQKKLCCHQKWCKCTGCVAMQQASSYVHIKLKCQWLLTQCSSALLTVCYSKVLANRCSLFIVYLYTRLQTCKSRNCVSGYWSVDTCGVNSEQWFKRSCICAAFVTGDIFNVNIAWLATLKPWLTIRPICWLQMFGIIWLPWISPQPYCLHHK